MANANVHTVDLTTDDKGMHINSFPFLSLSLSLFFVIPNYAVRKQKMKKKQEKKNFKNAQID